MARRQSRPAADRFWAKAQLDPDTGCMVWQAARQPNGYGRFRVRVGVTALAHRFAYELAIGPIPAGLQLDHLCRNRACVNPAHLEPVTPKVNVNRGECAASRRARARAITHCPRNHEYTPANTWVCKQGKRKCRACARDRAREVRAERKVA